MTLSVIDQTIKSSLMNYPTLYSDRRDVLAHLFISYGNGYEWKKTKKGYVLASTCNERNNNVMRFDDLDDDQIRLDAEILKYKDSSVLDLLMKSRQIKLNRERMLRQQRADNIDVFAQQSITSCMTGPFDYNTLTSRFALEYSKLVSPLNPWGKIEDSHVSVMEDLIKDLNQSFNCVFSLQYDHLYKGGPKAPEPSMFSRMPESAQKLHARLQEVRVLLDKQSGQLARDAEFSKMITGILEDTTD